MTDTLNIPDTCAACDSAWNFTAPDSGPASVDRPTADYPYCLQCHYSGQALKHRNAGRFAAFDAVPELRYCIMNTGGGCFVLHVDLAAAPSPGYDGVDDGGNFVPYVWATCAYLHGGVWAVDAGIPDGDEPWGAIAYLTQDAAEGGDSVDDMPSVAPADIPGIIAFALQHLTVKAA